MRVLTTLRIGGALLFLLLSQLSCGSDGSGRYFFIDKQGRKIEVDLVRRKRVTESPQGMASQPADRVGDLLREGKVDLKLEGTQQYKDMTWGPLSCGRARIGLLYADGSVRQGYIDETGRWIVTPQFSKACDYMEGLARVAIELPKPIEGKDRIVHMQLWGYLDTSGKMVIDPEFASCGDFQNGATHAFTPLGQAGYIDRRGDFEKA